jgi:hypothetical protein
MCYDMSFAAMKWNSVIPVLFSFIVWAPPAKANDEFAASRGGPLAYACCRFAVPLPCCNYGSNCRSGNGATILGPIYYVPNGPEARVQILLSRMGYYDGEIDGAIGPVSRRAIARYQAMSGLEVTGSVDGPLLNSLGLLR